MSLQAVSIEIYGEVQKVFYRASAKEKATELGLVGYVMNQADGSVSAQVCGDPKGVETFIAWCLSGPSLANVTELKIKKIPPFVSVEFEIRR